MQESYIEVSRTMQNAALDLIQRVNEQNRTSFEAMLQNPGGLAAWGKLAKSSLDAAKTVAEMGADNFNRLLRNEARVQELDALAANLEGFGEIVASFATNLTQLQVSAFNGMVAGYADSLRSLKSASSAEELLSTQQHLQAELQNTIKSSLEEGLQTLNALNSGLTAWVESSIDNLAGGDDSEAQTPTSQEPEQ